LDRTNPISHSGLFTYAGLNLMIGLVMWISRGSLVPKDYDQKQYWTWKPPGEKPFILRIFSRRRHWGDSQADHGSIRKEAVVGGHSMDGASAASRRGSHPARSVGGSRSVASRAPSTVDNDLESRRYPTPGPFRSMH
jgi:AGZA family xanthine/uracil permease-like MFS transporter